MPTAPKSSLDFPVSFRTGGYALTALLVAAAVVRIGALAAQWTQLSQDPDAYRVIAENLLEHHVYSCSPEGGVCEPTAFRPPLYPLLLAATAWQGRVASWTVAACHLVLGILTVLFTLWIARRWKLGPGSWLAAALVTVDPILLNQSAHVMTETLATFLAVSSLLVLSYAMDEPDWKHDLMAGAVLGLAVLCRPTFLIWGGLIVLAIGVSYGRWAGLLRAAWYMIGLVLVLSPWIVRNQLVFGQPIYATTHGGYTLLLGNNPHFYRYLRSAPQDTVWDAQELLPMLSASATNEPAATEATLSGPAAELAADRRLYDLARESIRQEPGMFVVASLLRIGWLWTPLPHQLSEDESSGRRWARWGVAVWYVLTYLGAIAGLGVLRRRVLAPPWVWGLLGMLAFTLVHSVYWSNMRMRAPLMPVIYLLLVAGWSELCARTKRCKLFHAS